MTEGVVDAEVTAVDRDGEDPHHHAVDIAAAGTVETLLDAGASVS